MGFLTLGVPFQLRSVPVRGATVSSRNFKCTMLYRPSVYTGEQLILQPYHVEHRYKLIWTITPIEDRAQVGGEPAQTHDVHTCTQVGYHSSFERQNTDDRVNPLPQGKRVVTRGFMMLQRQKFRDLRDFNYQSNLITIVRTLKKDDVFVDSGIRPACVDAAISRFCVVRIEYVQAVRFLASRRSTQGD